MYCIGSHVVVVREILLSGTGIPGKYLICFLLGKVSIRLHWAVPG